LLSFPDATPYQGGGPPGDQPNQPGPPLENMTPLTSYPNDFTALDDYIFAMLEAMGCRAAQLAIARAGKLVIVRSYTWAEEGYPVAKNQHLFRIGSISKPLTGMAVVAHFATTPHVTDLTGSSIVGPNGSLGFELVNPSPELAAKLADTTLYHLLSHISGWPGNFDESDSAAAGGHPLPALPGDATERVRKATADFYIDPVGTARYGGTVVQVLSEGVSWIRTKNLANPTREDYESQMQAWWFGSVNAGQSRAQLAKVGPQASLDGGQFPCHSRKPGVETGYINGVATRQPTTYAGNPAWGAGAGAWCMSAADVVRIWSGLDPSASEMQHLLTPEQVSLIRNDLRSPSGMSACAASAGT
jgi:CubicO group peptidase (beta-lactamase class C family)